MIVFPDSDSANTVRCRATKFGHLIQGVARDHRLGCSPAWRASANPSADDRFVPKEGVLHSGLPMVTHLLLPPAAADRLGEGCRGGQGRRAGLVATRATGCQRREALPYTLTPTNEIMDMGRTHPRTDTGIRSRKRRVSVKYSALASCIPIRSSTPETWSRLASR